MTAVDERLDAMVLRLRSARRDLGISQRRLAYQKAWRESRRMS